MCGISCIINPRGIETFPVLEAFNRGISHRGPDGEGIMVFDGDMRRSHQGKKDFYLGIGHRRLSILDLSEAGAQPMISRCGNYIISYNGEVYNYIELRKELSATGFEFRSNCDTEVILNAYLAWGSECVRRFNGMWAFVILDIKKRRLFVSRDRVGIKPLYWSNSDSVFSIASEIKQFFRLNSYSPKPETKACLSYLTSGYEIPPETFYKGIYAFPPAHYAYIDIDLPRIKPERYWDSASVEKQNYTEDELAELTGNVFSEAVRLRLRSDVPVGGCLSGGLDSSAIFIAMKNAEPEKHFNAFSACFDMKAIDERPFMRKITDATGARHIQVFPDATGLRKDIDFLLKQHDEPVGSVSMYAQYLVMKAARERNVPVLLDGQGGDELFSGYWPAYFLMLNGLKRKRDYPGIARHLAGAVLPGGNGDLIKEAFSHFGEYRRRASGTELFAIKEKYRHLLEETGSSSWHREAQSLSPSEYRIAEITKIHLPRLLKWEDRNSMAFSIESRVPFLDVNLIELVLSVPPDMNMKKGWTKYLFRRAMSTRLPNEICWRKDKKGFETPQGAWMCRGPFHDMLAGWAAEKEHPAGEFADIDFEIVRDRLRSGNFNQARLFRLFCLDIWLKNTGKF